jgi:hypothetical protein
MTKSKVPDESGNYKNMEVKRLKNAGNERKNKIKQPINGKEVEKWQQK